MLFRSELDALYRVKRQFVQRKAATRIKPDKLSEIDGVSLETELTELFGGHFDEITFAKYVELWSQDEATNAGALEKALQYAAWALLTPAGRSRNHAGVLFKQATKTDPYKLLSHASLTNVDGVNAYRIAPGHLRRREAFHLTDTGTDLVGALDQANYCIWCHQQGKDSCSRGLREKPAPGATQPIVFKKSPFGVTLAGCPLQEKISEFHLAKTQGLPLAALAIIAVDNPMVAATGHRICNDCMKA